MPREARSQRLLSARAARGLQRRRSASARAVETAPGAMAPRAADASPGRRAWAAPRATAAPRARAAARHAMRPRNPAACGARRGGPRRPRAPWPAPVACGRDAAAPPPAQAPARGRGHRAGRRARRARGCCPRAAAKPGRDLLVGVQHLAPKRPALRDRGVVDAVPRGVVPLRLDVAACARERLGVGRAPPREHLEPARLELVTHLPRAPRPLSAAACARLFEFPVVATERVFRSVILEVICKRR